ncbi:hypothetical protein LA76x_1110 [Lysobacter antibioticus]|uniref:Uncharacterized protein n=1 Tax=Lysobacter antibioticus TaxID=84531 RepID=A0A0S2F6T3_LYSAN|nr:hypothetical protein LA76x_1110 [Lysobacter antibioticus]
MAEPRLFLCGSVRAKSKNYPPCLPFSKEGEVHDVFRDLGLGTWDLGLGTWDLGLGTWDLGGGRREAGGGLELLGCDSISKRSICAFAPRRIPPRISQAFPPLKRGAGGICSCSCSCPAPLYRLLPIAPPSLPHRCTPREPTTLALAVA